MTVIVNGQPREVPDGAMVHDVLAQLDVPERGVAVAVDGTVAPRRSWGSTPLTPGARVDVLTAVQGG